MGFRQKGTTEYFEPDSLSLMGDIGGDFVKALTISQPYGLSKTPSDRAGGFRQTEKAGGIGRLRRQLPKLQGRAAMKLSRNGSGIELSTEGVDMIGRVVGVARFMSDQLSPEEFATLVSIDDHKGQLTLTWSREPSAFAVAVAQVAWTAEHEDGQTNRHKFSEVTP